MAPPSPVNDNTMKAESPRRGFRTGGWLACGSLTGEAMFELLELPEHIPVLLTVGHWASRIVPGTQ